MHSFYLEICFFFLRNAKIITNFTKKASKCCSNECD